MTSYFALGREQVEDIDATLKTLQAQQGPLKLCFSNHWAEDGENPALLAAALIGALRERSVIVNADDQEAVDGLLRFGLATALSRRRVELTQFNGPTAGLDLKRLRLLWTPGSRRPTQAMFAQEETDTPTDAYGPTYATFVNPHLSSAFDGQPDVVFLVRRWLTRRLHSGHDLGSVAVERTVAAVGLIATELVSNVQEHASGEGTVVPDCLMRVSLTDSQEVWLSILDTGVGLDHSLRVKLGGNGSGPDRITKLVDGALPGWDAARGIGLPRVAAVVAERHGRLSIATDGIRIVLGDDHQARSEGFELQGTVINCRVPVS
jgi:hypothetical protein